MATYEIKWLKNKLGTKFFPVTHLKAVRDDYNVNLETLLGQKQDILVSGTNIKTVNSQSILGSGNLEIEIPTKTSDLTNDSGFITSADIPESAAASTTTPLMDGTASVGTELAFARGDHRHPSDTSKADKSATVSAVTYNTTSKKITKTINGTTTDVITAAKIVTDGGGITSHQDISGKADKATTLSGYGITDAKIASGTITLGSNTITPLTASSTLDATKLSGTIPTDCYSNTDTKVTQTATTTNSAYEILFSGTADNTSRTEGVRKTSTLTYNPSTKALVTGGTVNGYTLAAASAKGVDTSIAASSSSANLPTSAAVASFVEGKGYLPTTGGDVTDSIILKFNSTDASLVDNGYSQYSWGSEVLYPTTFSILDRERRILARLEGTLYKSGRIGTYLYVRNYDTAGNQTSQRGLSLFVDKDSTYTTAYFNPGVRVGIGISIPQYALDVDGVGQFSNNVRTDGHIVLSTNNRAIYFADSNGNTNQQILYNTSNSFVLGALQNAEGRNTYLRGYTLNLQTGASTLAMFIGSDQKVGIGTSSPSYKLHVNGTIGCNDQLVSTVETGTSPFSITSTTVNNNLNADLWDGFHHNYKIALSGNESYFHILTIQLTNTYINDPITFDLKGRSSIENCKVSICFNNSSQLTNYTVDSFTFEGDSAYGPKLQLIKTADATFQLWCPKTQSYDRLYITNISNDDDANITFNLTASNTLPTGTAITCVRSSNLDFGKYMRGLGIDYTKIDNTTGQAVIGFNAGGNPINDQALYGAILQWASDNTIAPDVTNNTKNWYYQLIGTTSTDLYWRKRTNGNAWTTAKLLLDSGNYISYTVTKTGAGASGTWDINISGTATKATQDGSGNVITSKYVTIDTDQTITGIKNINTLRLGSSRRWEFISDNANQATESLTFHSTVGSKYFYIKDNLGNNLLSVFSGDTSNSTPGTITLHGNAESATSADLLDGIHAADLLSSLTEDSDGKLSITIGGTTKKLNYWSPSLLSYHHPRLSTNRGWWKIFTATLTQQYSYGSACMVITDIGATTGVPTPRSSRVVVHFQQQAAFGSAPNASILIEDGNIYDSYLKGVYTLNSSNTVIDVYLYGDYNYMQPMVTNISTIVSGSSTWEYPSNSKVLSTAPTFNINSTYIGVSNQPDHTQTLYSKLFYVRNNANSGNAGYIGLASSADDNITVLATNNLRLAAGSSVRAYITSTGNVGIGTTDPTQKLHVSGNILASGEITAYSDIRLKKNIKPLQVRGELKPMTYEKDGKQSIGFIAQDVQEIYPELVTEQGEDKMLSLNYAQLTAVLQAEILELKEEIKKLKNNK